MSSISEQTFSDRERILSIKAVLDGHIQQLPTIAELQQAVDAERDSISYSTGGKNLFYRGISAPNSADR